MNHSDAARESPARWESALLEAVRYGSVEVVIHDGRVANARTDRTTGGSGQETT